LTYLMEFGKYKGFPLHLIPNQYFTFLFESDDNITLIRYPTLYCKTHKELAKVKPDFAQRLNLQCSCRKKSYSIGYLTKRKDYKGDYESIVKIICAKCRKDQFRRTNDDSFYEVGAIFGKMCNTNQCGEDMDVVILPSINTVKKRNKNYRSALSKAMKAKTDRPIKTLPYSSDELKTHLSSLFSEGMSLENYGSWHIDHIKPVSSFLFLDEEDFTECWSLDNLQPLWAYDNIVKGGFNRKKERRKFLFEVTKNE